MHRFDILGRVPGKPYVRMPYLDRLKYSAAASVFVHAVVLISAGYQMSTNAVGVVPKSDPIVLNLTPRVTPEEPVENVEEPREQQRLIDPGVPTDQPVNDTDLISSHASKASSREASEGDPDTPSVDRIDEFDELGGQPMPAVEQPVQPLVMPSPAPVESPVEPVREPEPKPEPQREIRDEQGAMQVARAAVRAEPSEPLPDREPLNESRKEEPKEEQPPTQLAQAQPQVEASPPPVQTLRAMRGREDGGAQPGGVLNFEAKQHELGAYMLDVRNHVEREWRTALATRYAGVGRARAVLDCSIRPDGTLEYVRIVDGGDSPGFATLCKAAVERASRNFKPFPFEVPEIYRSKNLEVRWQFTYM